MSGVAGVPFRPFLGGTKSISVSSTSAETTISGNPKQLRLTNTGTSVCFFRFGSSTQTAVATTDMPVLPGVSVVVSVPVGTTNVAAITAALTTTLYVTPGYGE
ncbi:hypothetical protein UFOVP1365_21 [uncultured Caudovirales phage]|uniref:Uncharacterized protein n=1 Tax=uncultured Caudovirales phage TaxID=2100421 RepID=A0A6J5RX48_9CAUD|nr:hypothetical protein UFOVP1365_21 [uncultured Caudovirales phage]